MVISNKWLAAIGSGALGITMFLFLGYLLPLLPDVLQNVIEKVTGILVLFTFAAIGILSFKEISKYNPCPKYIKWITPAIFSCYGLMYFMYLAFDYGSKQTHVSAMGFNVITIALSILAYMFLSMKKNK